MTWYHGGPKIDGDWLLPPSETGALSTGDTAREHGLDGAELHEADKVYVVNDKVAALMFAAQHQQHAWIYEVEPENLGVDLDFTPNDDIISHSCDRARIVRRLKPSNRDVAAVISMLRRS